MCCTTRIDTLSGRCSSVSTCVHVCLLQQKVHEIAMVMAAAIVCTGSTQVHSTLLCLSEPGTTPWLSCLSEPAAAPELRGRSLRSLRCTAYAHTQHQKAHMIAIAVMWCTWCLRSRGNQSLCPGASHTSTVRRAVLAQTNTPSLPLSRHCHACGDM